MEKVELAVDIVTAVSLCSGLGVLCALEVLVEAREPPLPELSIGGDPGIAGSVLGFTATFASPGDYIWWNYGASSIFIYHRVFLSPRVYGELMQIERQGIRNAASADLLGTTEGLLTLIHESTHQKLHSRDESRVNACAVQAFPDVLTRDYGLPATVTTSHLSHSSTGCW